MNRFIVTQLKSRAAFGASLILDVRHNEESATLIDSAGGFAALSFRNGVDLDLGNLSDAEIWISLTSIP